MKGEYESFKISRFPTTPGSFETFGRGLRPFQDRNGWLENVLSSEKSPVMVLGVVG